MKTFFSALLSIFLSSSAWAQTEVYVFDLFTKDLTMIPATMRHSDLDHGEKVVTAILTHNANVEVTSVNVTNLIHLEAELLKTRGARKVINISMATPLGAVPFCPFWLQSAIDLATRAGAIIVVASGNNKSDASKVSPANCDNLVVVGAIGRDSNMAAYSNYGERVDIFVKPTNNERGTSFSAPVISALIAEWLAEDNSLTVAEAKLRLAALGDYRKFLVISEN
jgi:subtilisin family serine protease